MFKLSYLGRASAHLAKQITKSTAGTLAAGSGTVGGFKQQNWQRGSTKYHIGLFATLFKAEGRCTQLCCEVSKLNHA